LLNVEQSNVVCQNETKERIKSTHITILVCVVVIQIKHPHPHPR